MQIRRVVDEMDVRLIWFTGALLSLDVFFIAVFSAHTIYTAGYGATRILGPQWHIGNDLSYAEMFGYLKVAIIISILTLIRGKRQRPIYLALMLLFTVVLLDDSLQLHERVGHGIAEALALQSFAGWMSQQLGELVVWTVLGAILVTAATAGLVRSPQADRGNGLLLMGGFAVLVLFAVVADVVHAVIKNEFRFRGADFPLTVLEDGGEQITLSLVCSLAVLIHRELRSRESRPDL
jgi:hypothetical protein